MGGKARKRLHALVDELARRHPEIEAPAELVSSGTVFVDGLPAANPRSQVSADARIEIRRDRPLRGEAKLRAALATFGVAVEGRVTLDVGAAAGGFTRVLLEAGAAIVYAVDAGHGQLRGSVRQDPRVVALERVNLGDLGVELVPDTVDVFTVDLSYLSVAAAAPQLESLRIAPDADLIALVKPVFELGLARPPADLSRLDAAVVQATAGLTSCGWTVAPAVRSPVTGARGAVELLVHARRS